MFTLSAILGERLYELEEQATPAMAVVIFAGMEHQCHLKAFGSNHPSKNFIYESEPNQVWV